MDLSDFQIVTMISNSARYRSRYELYRRFKKCIEDAGLSLTTVEVAFGDRPWEITEENNANHVRLRTVEELWHKENALNLGIAHICRQFPGTKYIATIDADVMPLGRTWREWMEETKHELQHFQVAQMFEQAIDFGPNGQIIGEPALGFMYQYFKNDFRQPKHGGSGYYEKWHPGYAWAYNVDALDKLGGLIDIAILGAGDRHMALGLVGAMDQSFESQLHPEYKSWMKQWEARAEKYIKRDVGYVRGAIGHSWHGRKKERFYHTRWKILTEQQYNPLTDIHKDRYGLWQLNTDSFRQMRLRDLVRAYFKSRNEDSIDVE